jgi:hypothetical protein
MAEPDGQILIEKTQTRDTTLSLSVEEMLLISQGFSVDELRRQANLTDEALLKAAKEHVDKCSRYQGFMRSLYFAEIPGGEEATEDFQLSYVYKKYSEIRDKLKDLLSSVESKSKSVHKFNFGLEMIKSV